MPQPQPCPLVMNRQGQAVLSGPGTRTLTCAHASLANRGCIALLCHKLIEISKHIVPAVQQRTLLRPRQVLAQLQGQARMKMQRLPGSGRQSKWAQQLATHTHTQ